MWKLGQKEFGALVGFNNSSDHVPGGVELFVEESAALSDLEAIVAEKDSGAAE
jgi:hypothetical protein